VCANTVVRRSLLWGVIPTRAATPAKPVSSSKPGVPPANKAASNTTDPKAGAEQPKKHAELIQALKAIGFDKHVENLKKDWGSPEKNELMRSTDYPDWIFETMVELPTRKQTKQGFVVKYNPNDPEELRQYAKRIRRYKIKAQNEMMKETKGIPTKGKKRR